MPSQLTNDEGSDERRNSRGRDAAPRTDGAGSASTETLERRTRDEDGSARAERNGASSVEDPEPEDPGLDIDLVFDLLGTSRRRAVVRYLEAEADPVEIGDLANFIAAQEYGKTVAEITPDERKRVYVSLYQCHLPKMAAADVIVYEQGDPVERGPYFDTFATMLTHADETIRGDSGRSRLSGLLAPFLK